MRLLENISSEQWNLWITQAQIIAQTGKLPNYIPLLNQVNVDDYAVLIVDSVGELFKSGNQSKKFPLMSLIKPFLLLYLLEQKGSPWVFERVGNQASEYPFNSLKQLQLDRGFPRNPMINSGAIRLADLLSGKTSRDRCLALQDWLNTQAQCQLFLDEAMLASVRSRPNQKNLDLAQEMMNWGHLGDIDQALDTYNQICCLTANIEDLAQLGLLLARSPSSIKTENTQHVQTLMATCGLYEASAQLIQEISLPTKSGVSGGVLSIIPNQGAIAIYSPTLDPQGNSIAGLFLLKMIAASIKRNHSATTQEPHSLPQKLDK
ncbi:MAG: glutaminase [Snowella sp.]|nr:glutaminase [Snowella sp.]